MQGASCAPLVFPLSPSLHPSALASSSCMTGAQIHRSQLPSLTISVPHLPLRLPLSPLITLALKFIVHNCPLYLRVFSHPLTLALLSCLCFSFLLSGAQVHCPQLGIHPSLGGRRRGAADSLPQAAPPPALKRGGDADGHQVRCYEGGEMRQAGSSKGDKMQHPHPLSNVAAMLMAIR